MRLNYKSITFLQIFCLLISIAAVVGAITSGEQLNEAGISPERANHLRRLIFFHFILSQIALVSIIALLYYRYNRNKRNTLIISYNEQGMYIKPPGIRLRAQNTYYTCLGHMHQHKLPPATHPIIVYPMFMQSGYSSGKKLEQELRNTYAQRGQEPQLYIQSVLGASPWLAQQIARQVQNRITAHSSILIVAHPAAAGQAAAPEPELLQRRLRNMLENADIHLAYFGEQGAILNFIRTLPTQHIILIPFLITQGIHYQRDLPTEEEVVSLGKTLDKLSLEEIGIHK